MPERSMLEWVLIGLVAGTIIRMLMPGRDPGGFVVAILIAIVGAMLGGMIAQMLGWPIGEGWGNDIAAGLGAVALMLCYRLVLTRRTRG
ncbi:MAG TPA: GlsB/YeaQ/YmgE family stress response membrane protein [Sphingomonas sp.]|nr:GlsB/YeaQ/YmgE family stress response membrane protein [Sphingomonas sp.]